ncbi:MAG: transposase, partial [Treponema sp.]|nr:transposase [Treponema sp.]
YTKEFKAEAGALAQKREKAVSPVGKDWGINGNQLYRWMHPAGEAAGAGLPPIPCPGTRN